MVTSSSCRVNGYFKDGSNYEECQTACLNELTCIGFAISNDGFKFPNRCYIHGSMSSKASWRSYPQEFIEISTTDARWKGVDCYRKIGNLFILILVEFWDISVVK